jgi:hypothetical protein
MYRQHDKSLSECFYLTFPISQNAKKWTLLVSDLSLCHAILFNEVPWSSSFKAQEFQYVERGSGKKACFIFN